MTVADDVLRELRANPPGLGDGALAKLLGKNHAQVNQVCHRLASQGLIVRGPSRNGIVNRIADGMAAAPASGSRTTVAGTSREWAWEGHVQSRLGTYLALSGWSIVRVAETARQERGADIIAERDGERLIVEAKGWPSTVYARGERAGQAKPTQPTTQAAVWFAQALTTLIRHGNQPDVRLAMGLPDMPRYRALLGEAAWALRRLEITVYLVTEDGTVHIWEAES